MGCEADNERLIVAVKLGKCLLNERSPESTVITDFREGRLPSFVEHERNTIVDRDGRGDSEDVELEAVDSIGAELGVEEDPFKSTGLICDGCSSMHEPAIVK